MSSTWIDALMNKIMDCRTISRVPGQLRVVWQTSKRVGQVSVHCQFGAEYAREFQVSPEIKIVSAWCRTNVNLENKCMWTYIDTNCFLVLVWGTYCWNLSRHFWIRHLCIVVASVRNLYNGKYYESFVLHFSSRCVRYNNKRNKLSSTRLVSALSLIGSMFRPQRVIFRPVV